MADEFGREKQSNAISQWRVDCEAVATRSEISAVKVVWLWQIGVSVAQERGGGEALCQSEKRKENKKFVSRTMKESRFQITLIGGVWCGGGEIRGLAWLRSVRGAELFEKDEIW